MVVVVEGKRAGGARKTDCIRKLLRNISVTMLREFHSRLVFAFPASLFAIGPQIVNPVRPERWLCLHEQRQQPCAVGLKGSVLSVIITALHPHPFIMLVGLIMENSCLASLFTLP